MGMLTGGKDDQNKLSDDKWSGGTLKGLQPHIMTSLTKKGHKKEPLEKSHCHSVNYYFYVFKPEV